MRQESVAQGQMMHSMFMDSYDLLVWEVPAFSHQAHSLLQGEKCVVIHQSPLEFR